MRSPEPGATAGSLWLWVALPPISVPDDCFLPRGQVGGRASPFHLRKGYRAMLLKELHQGLKAPGEVWVKLGCFERIWISEYILFSFFKLKFNLTEIQNLSLRNAVLILSLRRKSRIFKFYLLLTSCMSLHHSSNLSEPLCHLISTRRYLS